MPLPFSRRALQTAPSFSRDFAGLKTLDHGTGPSITFTRASDATYFDADGVLQTAANDTPRFDHDPATAGNPSRGLLIEESRTNLLQRSEEFDDAYWTADDASITANAATSPSGTTTADKLVENSATSTHRVRRTQITHAGTAATVTATVFAKAAERSQLQIDVIAVVGSDSTGGRATFNLSAGTVGAFAGTQTGTGTAGTGSASITAVGSGWYRCVVVLNPTAGITPTSNQVYFSLNNGTSNSYTGDGTSGLYLWGAQLEVGAFPTSYIPTTSAAVTRAADGVSVTPISSFYNTAEGTMFAEVQFPYASAAYATANRILNFGTNGSGNNQNEIRFNQSGGNQLMYLPQDGVGTAAQINSTTVAAGDTVKLAAGYAVDNFAFARAGSLVGTDTSGTVATTQTHMVIGSRRIANSTDTATAYYRKIAYWPKRLTNTLLEQLTT
jgi:hypothetical protein